MQRIISEIDTFEIYELRYLCTKVRVKQSTGKKIYRQTINNRRIIEAEISKTTRKFSARRMMTGIFVSEVAVKVDARFRRQKVKLSLSILLVGVLSRGAHRRECESRPKNTFTFVSREPPTAVPITRFLSSVSIIDQERHRYPRFSIG